MAGSSSEGNLPKNTFLGIIWTLYALCVVAFAARLCVRLLCFRRLFVEDYLMVAVVAILTGINAMSERYAASIYYLMAWTDHPFVPSSWDAFYANTEAMLKACGSAIILFLVSFYLIKVNFLLFFYRMGDRLLRIYRIVWWIVFAVVVSCGITSVTIGVETYECLFSGINYTLNVCETDTRKQSYFTFLRITVALDIITDALLIGFPVWLLWGIKITTRKKIALGGIFSLVGFTIVATILRGALLSEVFAESALGKTFNIPWVWFWFHIELCVAFIVACLVSFRALFAPSADRPPVPGAFRLARRGRKNPSGNSATLVGASGSHKFRSFQKKKNNSNNNRFRAFQDSVLDTCWTLEGLDHEMLDVEAAQARIGGLRDMSSAVGTGGGGYSPSSHDRASVVDPYLLSREQEEEEEGGDYDNVERDSQGVSAMEEAPLSDEVASAASTSQLSLDSLYMSQSRHSEGQADSNRGQELR